MVKGLDIFRDYFRSYRDNYILIGGTACDLAFQEAGMTFRATKDLDIVLCIETLNAEFIRAFWGFIKNGQYENKEKATKRKQFYRFSKPQQSEYPAMLELFSRKPDALSLMGESHLTPLPTVEEISSLSAILLNDDYYEFIHKGRIQSFGLTVLGPDRLIPLKIHAWMDLSNLQNQGENISSHDIKKHRNDVLRLSLLLDRGVMILTPEQIQADIREFIDRMPSENLDIKSLGLRNLSLQVILKTLAAVYGVE